MNAPRRRVLVLGLDGGTFDLLDPLMQAGELPFLRSLTTKAVSYTHLTLPTTERV